MPPPLCMHLPLLRHSLSGCKRRRGHCRNQRRNSQLLPDPKLQFVAEVDASDVGVGAVLNQRSVVDNLLHPHAFMPRKLSPDYNIGNCELLAVKVALEEWSHWLEGAALPFLVFSDPKASNTCRQQSVNSRQARCALFFNGFNLHLSFRPGFKNTKPDALSCIHSTNLLPDRPETILPSSCLVGEGQWEVVSCFGQLPGQQTVCSS